MRQKGSILVGLLWCMALLSVVVVTLLHTVSLDLTVVKNHGDRIQARYLALAGVEKAKALLYHDAVNRRRSGRNHGGELYDDPADFKDVAFGRGHFKVFRRARPDEGGGIIYGIADEESRLNVNVAATNELSKLQDMTPDVVAAIIDWRDDDNEVSPGGAEADYYASLQPPYLPRNGPLLTTRELLMVRGVTYDLLVGRDSKQNGLLEYFQGRDRETLDSGDPTGFTDTGWAGVLTVDSTDENVDGTGQPRVNAQEADETALTGVRGITRDIARAIIASRGRNQLQSVADLLDVTAAGNQNGNTVPANNTPAPDPNAPAPSPDDPQPAAPAQNTGPKIVSEDLLGDIADGLTADSAQDQPGLVNVNTAGLAVLACLPGLDRQSAQAIISFRKSSGYLQSTAGLLKVPGITPQIFKQIAPRVTVRSETYRILGEGWIPSSGVRQRIQVVVHVGLRDIDTLSYREDL